MDIDLKQTLTADRLKNAIEEAILDSEIGKRTSKLLGGDSGIVTAALEPQVFGALRSLLQEVPFVDIIHYYVCEKLTEDIAQNIIQASYSLDDEGQNSFPESGKLF